MVASSSLRSSAQRSVVAGGKGAHDLVDVAGIFGGGGCGVNIGSQCGSGWGN